MTSLSKNSLRLFRTAEAVQEELRRLLDDTKVRVMVEESPPHIRPRLARVCTVGTCGTQLEDCYIKLPVQGLYVVNFAKQLTHSTEAVTRKLKSV